MFRLSPLIQSLVIFGGNDHQMAKIGIAGNAGDRIRSDCLVQVERVSSGGITINLDSKVEKLYGRSIRELAIRMLEHFGLPHQSAGQGDTLLLPP